MASSKSYAPRPMPKASDEQSVLEWANSEFLAIARQFNSVTLTQLDVQNVAPPKPREGMIAFADGTDWNPGAGRGYYGFVEGTWTKLH